MCNHTKAWEIMNVLVIYSSLHSQKHYTISNHFSGNSLIFQSSHWGITLQRSHVSHTIRSLHYPWHNFKNWLLLPRPTRNTCKTANKLITIIFGKINLQSNHDPWYYLSHSKSKRCHTRTFHGWYLFSNVINVHYESNTRWNQKYILYKIKKTISVTFIFGILMFQQLLMNKYHRKPDSKSWSQFG